MPGPWTRHFKDAAAALAQASPWVPATLAAAWGAGSGEAGLAVGLGLLARARPDPALAHARRRRILEAIARAPGIGLRDLEQVTQMPMGTLRHHVRVLLERGIIMERRQGRVRRF
ncbi:MAG TPA: helix-turn-helix domain-containing protein, partial [Candidatus Thermoplasmatota archaeon]|nr:helix-turn-helix domain-containing protein [Candidatus Thermoplasmatota archaeon]